MFLFSILVISWCLCLLVFLFILFLFFGGVLNLCFTDHVFVGIGDVRACIFLVCVFLHALLLYESPGGNQVDGLLPA